MREYLDTNGEKLEVGDIIATSEAGTVNVFKAKIIRFTSQFAVLEYIGKNPRSFYKEPKKDSTRLLLIEKASND